MCGITVLGNYALQDVPAVSFYAVSVIVVVVRCFTPPPEAVTGVLTPALSVNALAATLMQLPVKTFTWQ